MINPIENEELGLQKLESKPIAKNNVDKKSNNRYQIPYKFSDNMLDMRW